MLKELRKTMNYDELKVAGETFIQSFKQNSNGVAVRNVLFPELVNNQLLGLPLRGALND